MVIMKFALVALVLCVGVRSQHPSTAEFNLFCRIWTEANDMMLEPDYIYDEDKDQEIVKEMQVLYNATTDNMEDFRRMLWVTKDFFQEHPPPTHSESRKRAHREIAQLIDEGERKIEENLELASQVNQNIESAKLSAAQGFYGEHVESVPKNDGNLTEVLDNTTGIFNHNESPSQSCGENSTLRAGKTLLNDFFCVCVGDGGKESDAPCSGYLLPPRKGNSNAGGWKKMKYETASKDALEFHESIKKIEGVCKNTLEETSRKNILGLLDEYEKMIGKGTNEPDKKKIFGHSGRKNKGEVSKCDGSGNGGGTNNNEKNNAQICVNYSHNQNGDGKYNIPWHTKFRNYTTIMKEAKKLEDQILKNRAALLLLKSQAWVAYSREKDDETSNLDDMNVSNLFDGARLPFSSSFHFPFLFLFLIS
ncbi:Variant surface glycoprotein [Trypanosoma congolense IL3000]|uniref:Variant surface glycoprotein n=1 Tax=Trypanosoma congolense (strain IL3000) TaxID=1068625 RepID=F9WG89_TRYCI|nr:Variant surface glycoprotein [Trypanosoma congolense IL3000]